MALTSAMEKVFSISRQTYPFSRKVYVSIDFFRILKARVSDAYEYNVVYNLVLYPSVTLQVIPFWKKNILNDLEYNI